MDEDPILEAPSFKAQFSKQQNFVTPEVSVRESLAPLSTIPALRPTLLRGGSVFADEHGQAMQDLDGKVN